jgi:hypothetical protein
MMIVTSGHCPVTLKRKFVTRAYARAACKGVSNERQKALRIYLCKECGAFHMTSSPAKKVKAAEYFA